MIGGTSGIGLALVQHYLGQGASVAVCGRDLGRLDAQFIARHSALHGYQFDIGDRPAVAAAIDEFAQGGLDLLFVCAGLYADGASLRADPGLALKMLETNVSGLNHAFELAARHMRARGAGQLVAISSIAGLLKDYPGASLYSTVKRTVLAICEAYRKALAPAGIAVTAIVPGYVDTDKLRALNQGDASGKPFLMSEADAVAKIVRAVQARVPNCIFPWQLHWQVMVFNSLPTFLRRLRRT